MYEYFHDKNLISNVLSLHEGVNHLDTKLRQDYEHEHGKLEDIEEYQQALLDKDSEGLKAIIYQYAKDIREIRERKLAWKEQKIIEENKRKD
eukprot:1286123-Amphidinium_carterae.1